MTVANIFDYVLGDGARSTKFDLVFAFAAASQQKEAEYLPMLVKSTEFPSKGHTRIDFRFEGRVVPIRGQVTYRNQWTCTFYLTEDHALKRSFERWIEALDETVHYGETLDDGVRPIIADFSDSKKYVTDVEIYQASFAENSRKAKYVLHNVFPVEVSNVPIGYEGPGQLLTFEVTFAFSHFSESLDFNMSSDRAPNFINDSQKLLGLGSAINTATAFGSNRQQLASTINAKYIDNMLNNSASQLKQKINNAVKLPNFQSAQQLLTGAITPKVQSLVTPIQALTRAVSNFVQKGVSNLLS